MQRIDVAVAHRKATRQQEQQNAKDRKVRQAADPVFNKINLTLKCFISPVIAFFLLLAIPVLGNVIVLGGAGLLGCNTGENNIHPCILLGSDIGSFVYGYIVDIFLVGGLNPFLAVMGFIGFLHSIGGMVWLITASGLFAARETRRHSYR